MSFWCITTFFNPANYKSLLNNYYTFRKELTNQKANLLTVELSFNDNAPFIQGENVHHLRGTSVMWQKERLVNYAVTTLLPKDCTAFAWLDCDVIFSEKSWQEMAIEKLQSADIIQLYKKIYHLPPGHQTYQQNHLSIIQGVVWQKNTHKNWLERRKTGELPFSCPGFAWAARRDAYAHCQNIYDKNIIGSGDTFLVDCYFDSWDIHGYAKKFNNFMKVDMMKWCQQFKSKEKKFDFLPIDAYHLWHGNLKNRKYMDRHDAILNNNYDPNADIKLENNVYEWNSNKPIMHEEIKNYFFQRKEDEI